jgi:acetyl-CoA carboxylase biotin carboxyl carrier protein
LTAAFAGTHNTISRAVLIGAAKETPLNLKELKEILQMLDERDITEFELEEEGKRLRVRRAGAPHSPAAAPSPLVISTAPTPVPSVVPTAQASEVAPRSSAPPPPPAASAEEAGNGLTVVKSPIVGTFYRAPDPNAAPFVSVGDHVKVGQVLCIIEAMKLMNEIEAEVAGEIVKVHHDSGQPVQYGEPLFTIRP